MKENILRQITKMKNDHYNQFRRIYKFKSKSDVTLPPSQIKRDIVVKPNLTNQCRCFISCYACLEFSTENPTVMNAIINVYMV